MDVNLILLIIFAGVAVAFMIAAVSCFGNKKRVIKKCSETTMGRVIKHKVNRRQEGTTIAPVVEFEVDGISYTACRRYRGVVSLKKTTGLLEKGKVLPSETNFFVSENDWFHITAKGYFHDLGKLAEEVWPIGSELPVVYNPKKPKQAYVEKVVVFSDIVAWTFFGVSCLFIVASMVQYFVFV